MAHTERAARLRWAHIAAGAAVVGIPPQISSAAILINADASVTIRRRSAAGIATSPAVIRIRIDERANPVAENRAIVAPVDTMPADTCSLRVGPRLVAGKTAFTAVVEVVVQIGAVTAAAGLSRDPAVVAAGPAIGVGLEIATCPVASRGGAADVPSA
jgi:hypothetical protein